MADLTDVHERLFRDVKVPSGDFHSRALHLIQTEEGCALLRDIGDYDATEMPVAVAMLFRRLWGVEAPTDFQSVRADGRTVWNWSEYTNHLADDPWRKSRRYTDADADMCSLSKVLMDDILLTIVFVKSHTRRLGRKLSREMFTRQREEIRACIATELLGMMNATSHSN